MTQTIDAASVWDTLKSHPITMLTTQDGDKLVSRPMGGYARPEEERIYFLTRLETGKTHEIGRAAPVNLAYADPKANTYVSVSGTASVSQDRAKIRDLWSKEAEAWLPDGPGAPDTALITVTPGDATIWDSTSSKLLYAIKLVTAIATQSPPDAGRVEHVTL